MMEKNQLITIIIVALVAIASMGIGLYTLNKDKPAGDMNVIDSRGRTVSVSDDIDTILCIRSCSLELVSYFDAVNKVCAIDSDDKIIGDKSYTQIYSDLFDSLNTITVSNAEEIIQLNPSVIISSTVSVTDLDQERSTYGIPVYGINADLEFGSEAWFDQITKLGILLDEEDRASEINNGVRDLIADITAKTVTNVSGYTCGMMFYGAGNFLKTSGDYLPYTYSGVTNVMSPSTSGVGGQPYNTTIEEVLAQTFDYIFIDGSSVTTTTNQINNYIGTTTLGSEPAILNGNIYKLMVYKNWGTQWDNQLINCFYVADIVNGNAYNWTFEEKANEVIQLLYKGTTATYADLATGQTSGGCGMMVL